MIPLVAASEQGIAQAFNLLFVRVVVYLWLPVTSSRLSFFVILCHRG